MRTYVYRYLETFKAYEHKGCESIQERVDAEYGARWVGGLGKGGAECCDFIGRPVGRSMGGLVKEASLHLASDTPDYATPMHIRLSNALTSIRAINKTDAMTLSSNLGSLADIMRAPKKDLVMCPGKPLLSGAHLDFVFQFLFQFLFLFLSGAFVNQSWSPPCRPRHMG